MYKLATLAGAASAHQIFSAKIETEEQLRVFALNKYNVDKYTLIMFVEGLVFGALGVQVQNMATCVEDGLFEIKEAQAILKEIVNLDVSNVPTSLLEMF